MYTNFKKRCARDMEVDGLSCVVIRYGQSAEDANGRHNSIFYDLSSSYAELSRGGRRPGNPIEEEWKKRQHYFNERIVTDDERQAGQTRATQKSPHLATNYGLAALQGSGDATGVGARDGGGGANSVGIIEASEPGAGRGDPVDRVHRDNKEKKVTT